MLTKTKILSLGLLLATGLLATGCENYKVIGNRMETGAYTYYYAYVKSSITGEKYYHIDGWKEYDPEGGVTSGSGVIVPYVGLELHLFTSKDVIYYYEPGLSYVLSKQYNPAFGEAIE